MTVLLSFSLLLLNTSSIIYMLEKFSYGSIVQSTATDLIEHLCSLTVVACSCAYTLYFIYIIPTCP